MTEDIQSTNWINWKLIGLNGRNWLSCLLMPSLINSISFQSNQKWNWELIKWLTAFQKARNEIQSTDLSLIGLNVFRQSKESCGCWIQLQLNSSLNWMPRPDGHFSYVWIKIICCWFLICSIAQFHSVFVNFRNEFWFIAVNESKMNFRNKDKNEMELSNQFYNNSNLTAA